VLALAITQNHPEIPLTPFEKGESSKLALNLENKYFRFFTQTVILMDAIVMGAEV
jgi:hypothetical protein